jgi:hypothetical protein
MFFILFYFNTLVFKKRNVMPNGKTPPSSHEWSGGFTTKAAAEHKTELWYPLARERYSCLQTNKSQKQT